MDVEDASEQTKEWKQKEIVNPTRWPKNSLTAPPQKKQEQKEAKLRKKHTLVSSQALNDPLTKNLPLSSLSQPHVPANSLEVTKRIY